MTRTTRVIVLVLVAVLVLGSVGAGVFALIDGGAGSQGERETDTDADEDREPAPPLPEEDGARQPPQAALAPFYEQTIAWEPCGSLDCATLTVPVDYADPQGQTFELALNRRAAEDPQNRLGALAVNPGGPGAPGTTYVEQASLAFRAPLLGRYDLVGFDPRGTGASDPVDCLPDEGLDALRALDPDPDTEDEVSFYADSYEQFFAGCVQSSDELVGHVTTVETARDLDVLRAALGQNELDYFGASYGTKLGATYAELFPAQVGRFVLDGAVDVTLGSRELSLAQAGGFETALRAYVQDCLDTQGPDCFLGSTLEVGLATIAGVVEDADAQPLPTNSEGRELSAGLAFYGIITPLYNRDYWELLTQGLQMALDGDGTMLLFLSDAYASREPSGYADNSAEAILAINCLDDPYSIPPEQVPGQYAAFEEASPTFGRIFAWGLVGCRGIQVQASEPPPTIRARGAAPILVTGTTRDPATPYAWAVALADQLESGVLLSRDGDGHTAYNQGNGCADAAIEAYLLEGYVPTRDVEC
ncbi:alpha/beta hydrolase [Nocardioides nanhaiensis]|uniref:Alpha/beta hydrolase n=1 Tax=Nocardioides nanhaiensis TaxID=1476871 RepID=A0ABP8VTG0_9ACTN